MDNSADDSEDKSVETQAPASGIEFRVDEVGPCRKKVTVVIPAERVRREFDVQYREINKNLVLPGFRPGKAPRRVLEARFASKISDEVKSKIVEAAYDEMLEAKKVEPIARPAVDVEKASVDPAKPFEFAFEVVVKPEFALPEWKGIEARVPQISVKDADVDAAIERMRISEGTLGPSPDGVVAADDVVVADLVATEGETRLETLDNAYYRVGTGVIEGIVVEGLDAAVVGGKVGTVADLVGRAAPDDTREALRGKEFAVHVEVKDVKRFVPAALDEAFLKARDYDDVEELRKDVHRKLVRAQERARDRMAEERVLDALIERAQIPLPEAVVESAVGRWLERRRLEAEAEGVAEEEITKEAAASKEEVRRRVERDLREHFLLGRLADAEKIEVSQQEIEGAVEQIARDSGRASGEVAAAFREPARLTELHSHLRHQKAREVLRRAASIIEESPTPPPATEPAPKEPKKKKK